MVATTVHIALTHIVGGKTIKATFKEYKCQTRLTIYVPLAEYQAKGVKKAIVILEKPHTHPLAPDEKPTYSDAKLVRDAINRAGAQGLTAGKLIQGMSALFQSYRISNLVRFCGAQ